jgi:MFS family permease
MATAEAPVAPATASVEQAARPTLRLTRTQLIQISIFWFATNAMWGGWEIFQQERGIDFFGDAVGAATPLLLMELLVMPVGALAMPIMGSVSDYTSTRWGRRKPYILVGSILAFLTLLALAFVPSFGMMVVLFVFFQLATHIARGPFAGLVPDLVPEEQVGTASGLMGLMIVLGLIGGTVIMWSGYLLGADFTLPTIALGVLILVSGIVTVILVPGGPAGKPREGRSWGRIALETFGTDLLKERDYLFLLGSRFCMLMGTAFFMNLNILYLQATFGLDDEARGPWVLGATVVTAVVTAVCTIPSARLSDRIGRKPVIYAAAGFGAVGTAIIGLAPVPAVMLVGVVIMGVGAGAFLAVDWALMTEIIPRASSGRYMGMSNIVEATNGPFATALGGGILAGVGSMATDAVGGRAAILAGVVLFAGAVLLLRPVREPRHAPLPAATAPAVPG